MEISFQMKLPVLWQNETFTHRLGKAEMRKLEFAGQGNKMQALSSRKLTRKSGTALE
jgi:hypothetical protein